MRSRSGMTLVEILAVVVILGLIAGTLAVSFSGSFGKAKHELAKTGIGQIVQKVERALSSVIDRTSFADLVMRWKENRARKVVNWDI